MSMAAGDASGDRQSRMGRDAFVARFGHVFEHSPWVVDEAWDRGLGPDAGTAEGLHARLCAVLRGADEARQLALVRSHPDLAGRLALAGQLSDDCGRLGPASAGREG